MNNGVSTGAGMENKPKTKIVCTLGPSCRSVPMIEKLLRAGLNVARFNFSHGSHAYHQETLDNLRAAMISTGIICAVMLDTKGPEIRTGFLKDGKVQLKQGEEITITTDYEIKGSDLIEVRKLLGDHAKNILLMSKVENQEGVANFDDIITHSDAFMVARGDLGMEIPIEKIFLAQKVMVYKCNIQGKPVVTATQMLESMIKSPRPTRAEATDVANAVLDGTDCVMLSGETAAGAYPELAVRTMAKICIEAESTIDYEDVFKRILKHSPVPMSPLESLAATAVKTANSASAALILVLTRGGSTAKLVAKYRPGKPILSVVVPEVKTDSFDWSCSDEMAVRHSLVFRGLIPVLYAGSARASHEETTEEALGFAIKHAKSLGLCQQGDSVVALHRIETASVIKILTAN
ncbi:Pyruvate kinase, cytosolic isozyme [Hibiscus syriacus]|uniref:pyruvate kinase n=1 Tax=Hibiscus syriacus TaxID=106335 RepID=A0A6A3B406_HIBSY|nr:Pyruvate kinase, cytosolic isozyme [Hibiscus syriacus]